jgi:hypothetical protein
MSQIAGMLKNTQRHPSSAYKVRPLSLTGTTLQCHKLASIVLAHASIPLYFCGPKGSLFTEPIQA